MIYYKYSHIVSINCHHAFMSLKCWKNGEGNPGTDTVKNDSKMVIIQIN